MMPTMPEANVPKPNTIVNYGAPTTNSALFLYGDPSSSKMALLCAGFADDHTVFQPFAKALSEKGVFCGVACLPGFDDREDAAWESHNIDGYTFDEMVQCIRHAAKILRDKSTHDRAEFTAIFHDWGAAVGSMWATRLQEEAKDASTPDPTKPDKIVHFDVLGDLHPETTNIPADGIEPVSFYAYLCRRIYFPLLAFAFCLQRYVSRKLAPFLMMPLFILLGISGLTPIFDFDQKSSYPLYGEKKVGIQRAMYMAYPYWLVVKSAMKQMESPHSSLGKLCSLHADWKDLPILYLYGTKKKAMFHDAVVIKTLEEAGGITKVVPVDKAGHYLYVQQQDDCLEHVLEYIQAKKP